MYLDVNVNKTPKTNLRNVVAINSVIHIGSKLIKIFK